METAEEILLKHLNKNASKLKKKFNKMVDWSIFIKAMYEYGEQQRKFGLQQGKWIEKYGT